MTTPSQHFLKAVQPDGWAPPRGYVNGMLAAGKTLYVAGQVGWDPKSQTPTFPKTFSEQFDLALSNVLAVISAGGGTPQHLAKLTIYVTDKQEYLAAVKDVGASWRKHLGKHFPAMALIEVKGLLEDAAKVEMEALAVLP